MNHRAPSPSSLPSQVVVSHPRTQHSHHAAFALHQAGMLAGLVTSIAFHRKSLPLSLMPNRLADLVVENLGKRVVSLLPTEKLISQPYNECIATILLRFNLTRSLGHAFRLRAKKNFIRQVVSTLQQIRPAALLTFDDSGLEAFQACQSLDCLRVLDQTTGHLSSGVKIYEEEKRRFPELAKYLPSESAEKVQRACQEVLLADWILCPSHYVQHTLRQLGIPEQRLLFQPYGVDTALFASTHSRTVEQTRNRKFRFIYVGRLSPAKGIQYLLQAFTLLSEPNIELLLVGEPCGKWPQETIDDPRIKLLGTLSHLKLSHLLSTADAFVFPSLHEGSALAVYEALASGLPVICTENSGAIIEDGNQGFVVPIRNSEALADKMKLLYANDSLRLEMGCAALEIAHSHSWQQYYQSLERHFQTIFYGN